MQSTNNRTCKQRVRVVVNGADEILLDLLSPLPFLRKGRGVGRLRLASCGSGEME